MNQQPPNLATSKILELSHTGQKSFTLVGTPIPSKTSERLPMSPTTSRVASLAVALTLSATGLVFAASPSLADDSAISPVVGPVTGGTRVTVPDPGTLEFVDMATSSSSTVALTADGIAYSWGANAFGQLGQSLPGTSPYVNVATPTAVTMPAGATFESIESTGYGYAALGSDGNIYTWGLNQYGTAGNGTLDNYQAAPVAVSRPDGVTFTAVSPGWYFTLGLDNQGRIWAWGENENGQLGNNSNVDSLVPTLVSSPAGLSFTDIAAGVRTGGAVTTTGLVYTWGWNNGGELGIGSLSNRTAPVKAKLATGVTVSDLEAGNGTFTALGTNGITYAWGKGTTTPIGNGTAAVTNAPVSVTLPAGVTFVSVDANVGASHTIALGSDGLTYVWGLNTPPAGDTNTGGMTWTGQLGLPSTTTSLLTPTAVSSIASCSGAIVAAGWYQSANLCNGTLQGWGYVLRGTFGDAAQTATATATPVTMVNPELEVTSVTFDALEGTELSENADGTWSVTTPAHAAGPVDVIVSTATAAGTNASSSTYTNGFTYEDVVTPTPTPEVTPTPTPTPSTEETPITIPELKGIIAMGTIAPGQSFSIAVPLTLPAQSSDPDAANIQVEIRDVNLTPSGDHPIRIVRDFLAYPRETSDGNNVVPFTGQFVAATLSTDSEGNAIYTTVPEMQQYMPTAELGENYWVNNLRTAAEGSVSQTDLFAHGYYTVDADAIEAAVATHGYSVLVRDTGALASSYRYVAEGTTTIVDPQGNVVADDPENTAPPVIVREVISGQDASMLSTDSFDAADADGMNFQVVDHEGNAVALDSPDVTITGMPDNTRVPGSYPITVTYVPDGVSLTQTLTIEAVAVTPEDPTQTDDIVTIPDTPGVDYQVDGVTVTGTISVGDDQTVTVTAVPQTGYEFPDDATTGWDFSYDAPAIVVTPTAPQIVDNQIVIPEVEGVDYQIDGVTVTGTISVPVGETVTVIAVARDDYAFPEGVVVSWEYSWTGIGDGSDAGDTGGTVTVEPGDLVSSGAGVTTGGEADDSNTGALIGLGVALAVIGAGTAAVIIRRRR